jgi:hypothetical protein
MCTDPYSTYENVTVIHELGNSLLGPAGLEVEDASPLLRLSEINLTFPIAAWNVRLEVGKDIKSTKGSSQNTKLNKKHSKKQRLRALAEIEPPDHQH